MELEIENPRQCDFPKEPGRNKLSEEPRSQKNEMASRYIKMDNYRQDLSIPEKNVLIEKHTERLYLASVSHAVQLLESCSGQTQEDAIRREELVNSVKMTPELVGNSEDFLHLAMALEAMKEYRLTIDICEYVMAVKKFCNSQWITVLLRSYMGTGQYAAFQEWVEFAQNKLKASWTRDLFCAAIDGYRMIWNSFQTQEQLLDTAAKQILALCGAFRRAYPFDERGYLKEAELYWDSGKQNRAKVWLEYVILTLRPDDDDCERRLVCPCCCQRLLDWMKDSDDYEQIGKIASLGLQYAGTSGHSALRKTFDRRLKQVQEAMQRPTERKKPIVDTDLADQPQVFTPEAVYKIIKENYHE